MSSGQDSTNYYAPGNDRAGNVAARGDTDTVNASYERYLRSLVFLVFLFVSSKLLGLDTWFWNLSVECNSKFHHMVAKLEDLLLVGLTVFMK